MKTTMLIRNIANPRRTTLAHLDSTAEVAPEALEGDGETQLPLQTANPRRTVLAHAPGA